MLTWADWEGSDMGNSALERWMFVSDVDATLLGDAEALGILSRELQRVAHRVVLVYNSSRPCSSVRKTLGKVVELPVPQFVVGALGTEIEEGPSARKLTEYASSVTSSWQRDRVVGLMDELGLEPHDAEYQTPLKASYSAHDRQTYDQAVSLLKSEKMKVKVLYSGGKDLDIIPCSAGKRAGIEFLLSLVNFQTSQVVVAGDSANDLDMFEGSLAGIVVSNAEAELKRLCGGNVYHARLPHAGGVHEGLRFWGVLE